jgi:hypothetical protein
VPALCLDVPDAAVRFNDNYFDLDAKEEKECVITSRFTGEKLLQKLHIRWLE